MKKLPPYGKNLDDLIKQNLYPSNYVFLWIGKKAWEHAQKRIKEHPYTTLLLPPFISASQYYWPVKQCKIAIIDTSLAKQDYIDEIVLNLYQDGAEIVQYFSQDFKKHIVYKEC